MVSAVTIAATMKSIGDLAKPYAVIVAPEGVLNFV